MPSGRYSRRCQDRHRRRSQACRCPRRRRWAWASSTRRRLQRNSPPAVAPRLMHSRGKLPPQPALAHLHLADCLYLPPLQIAHRHQPSTAQPLPSTPPLQPRSTPSLQIATCPLPPKGQPPPREHPAPLAKRWLSLPPPLLSRTERLPRLPRAPLPPASPSASHARSGSSDRRAVWRKRGGRDTDEDADGGLRGHRQEGGEQEGARVRC